MEYPWLVLVSSRCFSYPLVMLPSRNWLLSSSKSLTLFFEGPLARMRSSENRWLFVGLAICSLQNSWYRFGTLLKSSEGMRVGGE
jgi:hypothetical protein